MNLKTHTVYPEIHVDERFNWRAFLYDETGNEIHRYASEKPEDTRQNAIIKARLAIKKDIGKYERKEGVAS